MKIQYALWAIQTNRSNTWSSFPSRLSVNSISGQCQPRGPIMQHVFPCLWYHMTHRGFWGWNYRFQTCTQTHTNKHIHTLSSSLFAWYEMPAPLNHRHNSPRSSGLRLSALPPEKETGSIYHRAAGWRNAVGAAARFRTRSRAGSRKNKQTTVWRRLFHTLTCGVYTIQREHLLASQRN